MRHNKFHPSVRIVTPRIAKVFAGSVLSFWAIVGSCQSCKFGEAERKFVEEGGWRSNFMNRILESGNSKKSFQNAEVS
jgi:hypothetical protein